MVYLLPAWKTVFLFLFPIAVLSGRYGYPRSSYILYNDLKQMGATCRGLDTCQLTRGDNDLRFFNCHCDETCARLGTCCVDSKYRTHRRERGTGDITCGYSYRRMAESVFIAKGCKPDWVGEDFIRDQCLNTLTSEDLFLVTPVTDLKTGITYRNYFCFVCNWGDEVWNPPVFWDIHLYHDASLHNESVQDVLRDLKTGAKSIADYAFEKDYFYNGFGVPEKYRSLVKFCREGVVDTCAEDWTDDVTKQKCESYTAMVWVGDQIFQNPHCAICSRQDMSRMVCSQPGGYSNAGKPPYGFLFVGLLSLEDKVKRCPRNQVFDVQSDRCRPLRCGRGRTMVDGECVNDPQSQRAPPQTRPNNPSSNPNPGQSWLVWGNN